MSADAYAIRSPFNRSIRTLQWRSNSGRSVIGIDRLSREHKLFASKLALTYIGCRVDQQSTQVSEPRVGRVSQSYGVVSSCVPAVGTAFSDSLQYWRFW